MVISWRKVAVPTSELRRSFRPTSMDPLPNRRLHAAPRITRLRSKRLNPCLLTNRPALLLNLFPNRPHLSYRVHPWVDQLYRFSFADTRLPRGCSLVKQIGRFASARVQLAPPSAPKFASDPRLLHPRPACPHPRRRIVQTARNATLCCHCEGRSSTLVEGPVAIPDESSDKLKL